MIKTVGYDNDEMLRDIYELYLDGNVPQCDITYSIR